MYFYDNCFLVLCLICRKIYYKEKTTAQNALFNRFSPISQAEFWEFEDIDDVAGNSSYSKNNNEMTLN